MKRLLSGKIVYDLFAVSIAVSCVIFLIWGIQLAYNTAVETYSWTTQVLEEGATEYASDDTVGNSISVAAESDTLTHYAYCNSRAGQLHYQTTTAGIPLAAAEQVQAGSDISCINATIDIEVYSGQPEIFFSGTSPANQVLFAVRDGGAGSPCDNDADWSCAVVTSTASGSKSDVNFEKSGSAYHLAYKDQDLGLIYATCTSSCSASSSWSFEIVDTETMITSVHLAVKSDGTPVLAYKDYNVSKTMYASRSTGANNCDDADWQCFPLDGVRGDIYRTVSLAIDSNDNVGIAYFNESPGAKLLLAQQNGTGTSCPDDPTGQFNCETVHDYSDAGIMGIQYVDVTVKEDKFLLAWHVYDSPPSGQTDPKEYGLRFGYKYQDTWQEDNITTIDGEGYWPSIDSAGDFVTVGYYDERYGEGEAVVAYATVTFNTAPTTSATMTPYQSGANAVTVTTTVSDTDSDVTSLRVEHSTDGSTWSSSTVASADQNGEGDGVTTAAGNISDIDTDGDGSVDLTFTWDIGTDLASTDTSTVYIRVTPNDGTEDGSTVSSTAFAVDTVAPTAPGALSINTTSTDAFILNLAATSTDTNFAEYKIFYASSTAVTTNDSALTSSTDANLATSTFNGAATTTISNLTPNTFYTMNIWAYDSFGRNTSSTATTSAYTLANPPTNTIASANGTDSITVSWNANSNPSTTEYQVENVTNNTTSTWSTSTSYVASGLSANTSYTFAIKARNADGVETSTTTVTQATQEEQSSGGGGGGGGSSPEPVKDEPCNPLNQSCENALPAPSFYFSINGGATHINTTTVTLTINKSFPDEFMVANTSTFAGADYQDPTSTLVYTLPESDGEKKIHIKFKKENNGSTLAYTSSSTIILDTVAPQTPFVGKVKTGILNGKIIGKPSLRGTVNEPFSTIYITYKETEPPYRYSFDEGEGCTTIERYHSVSAAAQLGPSCNAAPSEGEESNVPTWIDGVSGNGLSFDGVDDEVKLETFSISSDGAMTFSGWFKASTNVFDRQMLFSYGTVNDWIGIDIESNIVYGFDDIDGDTNARVFLASVEPGKWYHVGMVIHADGSKQYYLNGEQFSDYGGSNLSVSDINNPALTIGKRYDNAYPFAGELDEVQILSRAASAAEMKVMANEYLPETESDTDEFGELLEPGTFSFSLDEASGCVVHDESESVRGLLQPQCSGDGADWWTSGRDAGQQALSFDMSRYVDFGFMPPGADGSFSVAGWVQLADDFDTRGTIFSYGTVNNWITVDVDIDKKNEKRFIIHDDIDGRGWRIPADPALSPGSWHHVALSVTKDGQHRLYVDGAHNLAGRYRDIPDTVINIGTTGNDILSPQFLVGLRLDNGHPFNGLIENFQFYAHALTAEDVASLANMEELAYASKGSNVYDSQQDPFVLAMGSLTQQQYQLAFEGGTTVDTKADENGDWEYTFPFNLDTGGYLVTVFAEDPAGNTSDSSDEIGFAIPETEIPGCTNPDKVGYKDYYTVDDGSCIDEVLGCTDDTADNYNEDANTDDGSCYWEGCTIERAVNYKPSATRLDDSCIIYGCTNDLALNTDDLATVDDGSCLYPDPNDDEDEKDDDQDGRECGNCDPTDLQDDTHDDVGGTEPAKNGDDDDSFGGGTPSSTTSSPIAKVESAITSTTAKLQEYMDAQLESFVNRLPAPVREVVERVADVARRARDQVKKVIDDPRVENVNEKVVAPVVVTAAAANVAVGFQLPQAFAFLRFLFAQPLLLLRRRKQKKWGVVYNAYTKQPVDLATVRVINDKTGRVVRSQVTDAAGRYFLLLDPGVYRIEIDKQGFMRGSELLKKRREDVSYANLYQGGETFTVRDEDVELNFNIPIDPVQETDIDTQRIIKEHGKQVLQYTISLVGFTISAVSYVISPNWWTLSLIGVHAVFFVMFRMMSKRRATGAVGVVRDYRSQERLRNVVVRIFDAAYDKLIETAVTDRKGRYGALVGPSVYYVTYDKPGYIEKRSKTIDYSSQKTRGGGGVIARDEHLVPGTVDKKTAQASSQDDTEPDPTREAVRDGSIDPEDVDKLREIAQYGKGKDS